MLVEPSRGCFPCGEADLPMIRLCLDLPMRANASPVNLPMISEMVSCPQERQTNANVNAMEDHQGAIISLSMSLEGSTLLISRKFMTLSKIGWRKSCSFDTLIFSHQYTNMPKMRNNNCNMIMITGMLMKKAFESAWKGMTACGMEK